MKPAALELYKQAVRANDFAAAAAAGDDVFAAGAPPVSVLNVLRWPRFDTQFNYHALSADYWNALDAATSAFLAASPRSPWAAFFRRWSINHGERPTRRAEMAANAKRLRAAPVKTWGWMRAELAKDHLILGLFRDAERDYRAALAYDPGDWPSRLFLAETLLCLGRKKDAFAASARGIEDAGEAGKDALAWAGEIDLWAGRRPEARRRLKKAGALGAEQAFCWMGGLLVGDKRYEEALSVTALGLKRRPKDSEARVWRAEAQLRLGRPQLALEEVEAAGADGGPSFELFLGVMKVLALDALGRGGEASAVFRRLPLAPVAFAAKKLKVAATPAALCEEILRLSGGIRRNGYERALWLGTMAPDDEKVGERFDAPAERLSRADALLSAEKTGEAAALIASLLDSRPQDPAVLLLEGRRLRRAGKAAAAAKVFARVKGLPAALHLAEALAQAGKTSAALSGLKRALKDSKKSSSLDVYMAGLYAGDFPAAVKAGEAVLEKSHRYEDLRRLTWLTLVHDYRSEDQPRPLVAAVLKNLSAYRKKKPDCPWARYWEFYFLEEAELPNDPASAAATGRYAWMRYQTGRARFLRGDFAGAAEDFKLAAPSSDPANWRALCFGAEAAWCLGRPEAEWRAAFDAAEAVTPEGDRLGMLTWKGEVLLWAGFYEEALGLIRASTARGPSDALVWEGAALTLLGRPEDGLDRLDVALARTPKRGDALLWRAETLLRLERLDDALAAAERAVQHYATEADVPNFYARALRGIILERRGDASGAAADWSSLPPAVRERASSFDELLRLSRGLRSELRAAAWLAAPPAELG